MATNKHAQIRYTVLDRCFRNIGRYFTLDDLLEKCNEAIYEFDPYSTGIKKRQLQDDIRFMKSEQGWNIVLDNSLKLGRKKAYRYLDTSYSISNQPINENDANQLKEALITLSRFKGLPQFSWIEELTIRLNDGFQLNQTEKKIISFEENEFLKGKDFIIEIYNAIYYKKVLEINYKNFKSKDTKVFKLHPYFLKQYNNRWFLLAKDDRFMDYTILALDRIVSINQSDKVYLDSSDSIEDYFEDIIGVTKFKNSALQKIKLKFSNRRLPYVLTKPIHGSQKFDLLDKEARTIQVELIINLELVQLILSFGEDVEVIEPIELRKMIRNSITLSLQQYN